MPMVKWILAIPHYVALALLMVVSAMLSILAWFSIMFTKKYPETFFIFQVGLMRWCLRVEAYAFLLTTDEYPPFSLE